MLSVNGSGTTYVVTVNSGTLDNADIDGFLTLQINDNESIVDLTGNSLSGPGALQPLAYQSQQLVIDRKLPAILSITLGYSQNTTSGLARYYVTFDESVAGTVDAADFDFIATGLPDARIQEVTTGSYSYRVDIATGAGTGTIELILNPSNDIADLAGNPLSAGGFADALTLQTDYVIERDPTVSISGILIDDVNGNGVRDTGEGVLAAQTIYVDANHNGQLDTGETSQATAADGSYQLSGLFSGIHDVVVEVPTEFIQSAPTLSGRPIRRVSVDTNDTDTDAVSERPSVDGSGDQIVFDSLATDIFAGDGPTRDVFLSNTLTGQIEWISVAHDGGPADGDSSHAVISDNGRFVAFYSTATNLVADDTNNVADLFVRDLVAGETTRVSVGIDGAEGNGAVSPLSDISGSGRYVAFSSQASNLVAGDNNGFEDVFVFDRNTGQTDVVSVGYTNNPPMRRLIRRRSATTEFIRFSAPRRS